MWKCFCKSDGSIDSAIVDMSFLKNKFVMEQINFLLWSTPEVLEGNPYIITDENNRQVLSSVKGTLGGHKKLKIYGRLDCPFVKILSQILWFNISENISQCFSIY